jgi:hypothetical protein
MNARQPLYLRPTDNPSGDAEAWENEHEARAEATEQIQAKRDEYALEVASREIDALTPAQWDASVLTGPYINQSLKDTPGEVLSDALYGRHPDEAVRALSFALLSSPGAAALRAELARYQAARLAESGSGFAPHLELEESC